MAEKSKVLVVDKTGTLTEGRPQVTDVVVADGADAGELLRYAASLEHASTHPLAAAIVARAKADGIVLGVPQNVTTTAGRGLEGEVDGRRVAVGSVSWLTGRVGPAPAADALAEAGRSVVAVAVDDRLLGVLGIADPLRATSPAAVARLARLGVEVVMITGDNAATARAIAQQAGILRFEAEVLPAGKADAVNQLKAGGRLVGMAGDGINDAPALAAADVSFAMAAGSDVAMQAADVTLMRDDLGSVADAISLSRATLAKIRQNLFFAFIYNVLGIPLAALGMLNPVIAGAAMAMSSVSVVSNSLLLRRWQSNKE